MKIIINTNYKKPLKYRIYDIEDKNRKLNSKGKIIGNSEIEFSPKSDEIIVRVRKNNLALTIIEWLYIMIVGNFFQRNGGAIFRIRIYDEVHILKIDTETDLQMFYRNTKTTAARNSSKSHEMMEHDRFYCLNYPSICETKTDKVINKYVRGIIIFILIATIIAILVYAIIIRLPN